MPIMKLNSLIKNVLFLVLISFLSCSKNEIIPEDIEVNDFVWSAMNAYYKYQGEIPDLADTKFVTQDELNDYLDDFNTPEELFNSLLYQNDIASIISADYNELEAAEDVITTTTGLFLDIAEDEHEGYYAYAKYVIKDSNAYDLGIRNGMIFTQINGATVTAETNVDIVYTENVGSLTHADYVNGSAAANGIITSDILVDVDSQQNPIVATNVFNATNSTIGYLAFNHFSNDFSSELNSVFSDFSSNDINALILDLRYNTGDGDIEMANYIGSMITGQFEGEVFTKQLWNEKVMTNINNEFLTTYFPDEIEFEDETSERINSLGLDTLYCIVSEETSSISVILLNALTPYITVVLIGEPTGNNNLVSTILYDSDDYTKTGENFNTNHTYAIQPIVFEAVNSNNENNALPINISINEDDFTLEYGFLGDENEPLTARTIEYLVTGAKPSLANPIIVNQKVISESANKVFFSF